MYDKSAVSSVSRERVGELSLDRTLKDTGSLPPPILHTVIFGFGNVWRRERGLEWWYLCTPLISHLNPLRCTSSRNCGPPVGPGRLVFTYSPNPTLVDDSGLTMSSGRSIVILDTRFYLRITIYDDTKQPINITP